MAKLLIYYAHPGHRYSRANAAMAQTAQKIDQVSFVDLYALYPRNHIDVDQEQNRVREHDVILFQHPFFWYSTPPIIKEWFDLVLEHGFAYGKGATELSGKKMMNALTAAGPEEAYSTDGSQHYPIRTFLTPIEQTARLCQMQYLPPYILFSSLSATIGGEIAEHVRGYRDLLEAIRDDRYDQTRAAKLDYLLAKDVQEVVGRS